MYTIDLNRSNYINPYTCAHSFLSYHLISKYHGQKFIFFCPGCKAWMTFTNIHTFDILTNNQQNVHILDQHLNILGALINVENWISQYAWPLTFNALQITSDSLLVDINQNSVRSTRFIFLHLFKSFFFYKY